MTLALDVPSLRADTPGVTNVRQFNNAGMALPPRPVLDAAIGHLAREAAIGGMEAMAEADDRIADMYDAVATLIGAHRDEIAFMESATRARDMAFYAVPFRAGDRVITANDALSRPRQVGDDEADARTKLAGVAGTGGGTVGTVRRRPDEYDLTLRQADQARTDFAAIEDGIEFIIGQMSRVPTQR